MAPSIKRCPRYDHDLMDIAHINGLLTFFPVDLVQQRSERGVFFSPLQRAQQRYSSRANEDGGGAVEGDGEQKSHNSFPFDRAQEL